MVQRAHVTPSEPSPGPRPAWGRVLTVAAGVAVLCLLAVPLWWRAVPSPEGVGGSGPSQPVLFHSFDGQSTYVELGSPRVLDLTGPMTLEAWIRPQTLEGRRDILSHDDSFEPESCLSLSLVEGAYQVGACDGRTALASARAPETDVGQWVHLAGVYDGAHWTLYRDGEQVASSPEPMRAVSIAGPWAIGARGGGLEHFFLGDIRDVRIWNLSRTPQQLRTGLGQLPEGYASGLVGDWPLNEGQGMVAEDATSNGNDGSIRQGVWGAR